MEFHESGSIPKENELILRTPSGIESISSAEGYRLLITRYTSKYKAWYICYGYWTLTESDLIELFNGEVPFEFNP